MLESRKAVLYNRLLDISACIHIPLKSFAIYVVVRHTPPQLRHYSYFILNSMVWNFLMNFSFTFMHIFPLFPALCFRVDGISSYLIDNEAFGHSMYIIMVFLVSQSALALISTFPHRYIVFVHPKLAARIRPAQLFRICAGVHVLFALFYFPLVIAWTVSYDDYPNKAELPARPFVFCFHPSGSRKTAIATAYLTGATIGVLVIVAFSFLVLRNVKKLEKGIVHDDTLALQKKVFASLLMMTAIAMFFGGIPAVMCICLTVFPLVPYGKEATQISIVVLCNHGTISAVAYLVFFNSYRVAVKRIFSNLFGKLTGWKNRVHSVVI